MTHETSTTKSGGMGFDPEIEGELPLADPPDEFDQYTLVLLYRGLNPPDLDAAASELLQRQHLGHLEAMKRRGAILASGPFSDQPDDTLRGLCIYRAGLDEARAMAENDPAVRRGRLRIVAFSWYTRKGALNVDAG
jgi:uncharacterized protein YciI